ncbi:MAG: hypothetical protein ACLPXB_17150 [Thiobacillaceae bacterium]
MRNFIVVFISVLMAGCASTSRTATEPAQESAQTAQPGPQPTLGVVEKVDKPATLPAVSVAPPKLSIQPDKVVEVQHREVDAAVTRSATFKTSQREFGPHEWLTAWAKDVQESLRPWDKACETQQQKY